MHGGRCRQAADAGLRQVETCPRGVDGDQVGPRHSEAVAGQAGQLQRQVRRDLCQRLAAIADMAGAGQYAGARHHPHGPDLARCHLAADGLSRGQRATQRHRLRGGGLRRIQTHAEGLARIVDHHDGVAACHHPVAGCADCALQAAGQAGGQCRGVTGNGHGEAGVDHHRRATAGVDDRGMPDLAHHDRRQAGADDCRMGDQAAVRRRDGARRAGHHAAGDREGIRTGCAGLGAQLQGIAARHIGGHHRGVDRGQGIEGAGQRTAHRVQRLRRRRVHMHRDRVAVDADRPVLRLARRAGEQHVGRGPQGVAGAERRAADAGATEAVGAALRDGEGEARGQRQRHRSAAEAGTEAAQLRAQLLGQLGQLGGIAGAARHLGAQPGGAGHADAAVQLDLPGLADVDRAVQRHRGGGETRRRATAGGQHTRLDDAGRLHHLVLQVEPEAGGVLDQQLAHGHGGVGRVVGQGVAGTRRLGAGHLGDQAADHIRQCRVASKRGVDEVLAAQRQRPLIAGTHRAGQCQQGLAVIRARRAGARAVFNGAGKAAAVALQHGGADRDLVGVKTAVAGALDDGVGDGRVQRRAGRAGLAGLADIADVRVVESKPLAGRVDVLAASGARCGSLGDRLGGEHELVHLALLQRDLQVVVHALGNTGRALVQPGQPVGHRHRVGTSLRDGVAQIAVEPGVAAGAARARRRPAAAGGDERLFGVEDLQPGAPELLVAAAEAVVDVKRCLHGAGSQHRAGHRERVVVDVALAHTLDREVRHHGGVLNLRIRTRGPARKVQGLRRIERVVAQVGIQHRRAEVANKLAHRFRPCREAAGCGRSDGVLQLLRQFRWAVFAREDRDREVLCGGCRPVRSRNRQGPLLTHSHRAAQPHHQRAIARLGHGIATLGRDAAVGCLRHAQRGRAQVAAGDGQHAAVAQRRAADLVADVAAGAEHGAVGRLDHVGRAVGLLHDHIERILVGDGDIDAVDARGAEVGAGLELIQLAGQIDREGVAKADSVSDATAEAEAGAGEVAGRRRAGAHGGDRCRHRRGISTQAEITAAGFGQGQDSAIAAGREALAVDP